ncbi:hypothetical protein [Pseudomonas gingeri]|uniref:hypothetical protein n=1 Tax=Pseudomonas gingeri TaxID=117681 RepID=UPI0015BA7FC8|nr:hypothetical protein [Pseudomonas gingeri]NWD49874.1 hypothetical protein [Pseudomonas gingeri]
MNNAETYLVPHVFTRHKLNLHALLQENQAWFRLQDVPHMLPEGEQPRSARNAPWWKRASRLLPSFS